MTQGADMVKMAEIIEGTVIIILCVFGAADFRRKSISVYGLAVFLAAALLARIFLIGDIAAGLAGGGIGICVCALGKISRGQIGFGDGLLLTATGLLLGFWMNMELFLTGLFLCALFSMGAIVLLHKGKSFRIPFVPFLAGAQLIRMVLF